MKLVEKNLILLVVTFKSDLGYKLGTCIKFEIVVHVSIYYYKPLFFLANTHLSGKPFFEHIKYFYKMCKSLVYHKKSACSLKENDALITTCQIYTKEK